MAQDGANPTRAYLIAQGIGDPYALNDVQRDVLGSLKPVVANTAKSLEDAIEQASAVAERPEDAIRAASLTRLGSNRNLIDVPSQTSPLPQLSLAEGWLD